MAVSATDSSTAAAAAATGTTASTNAVSATEDRFLKLLVAQLKNQDPLNPLDNAQVTSQMAQLSTVSGIDKLNQSLQTMLSSLSMQQGLSAAALVGKDVAVEGNAITVGTDGTARGGYSLESAADSVKVTITDAGGKTIRTLDLGPKKSGLASFSWDGKDATGKAVPQGDYQFSIDATAGGKAATVHTLAVQKVQGIVPASDGFVLNLGAAGLVPFAAVAQIL